MQIDPRLNALGVAAKQTANASWDLSIAGYLDETQAGGRHHIDYTVLDSNGKPLAGIACYGDFPQDPADPHQPVKMITDANGQANFPINANLDITLKNGPYFAYIEDQAKSDIVTGMGLPEHRHVVFQLTFVKTGGTPPPPPVDPSVAAIAAAKKLTWMPINTDGALYKFALKQNLGYPQTDEFEFTCNNVGYIGQVYNGGIVFVKKGDWGNCQWVKKP